VGNEKKEGRVEGWEEGGRVGGWEGGWDRGMGRRTAGEGVERKEGRVGG